MTRILLVDDSPSQLKSQKTMLEKNGFEVLIAEDGAKGIEMAKSEQPDLILMDIVMPEMNGFQATRKLSTDETTSNIPVIMVTTKDQETDKVWGRRQGAVGYVTKPVDEKELLAEITKALS